MPLAAITHSMYWISQHNTVVQSEVRTWDFDEGEKLEQNL